MNALKPLQNVRVLDFTWAWAGPHCTRLLADMGAEILRIESRARIDNLRGGQRAADGVTSPNVGGNFNQLNRNKESIALNLKDPRALELALRLSEVSDIVVSNFAPGAMERLGLGYEGMRAQNPGLIWAALSGFGYSGPLRNHVTFGPPMTFYSGLASTIGYGPEDEPRMLGSTYCDSVAGGHMAVAILAALHHRRRTGEGQFIDLSMLESTLSFLPEMVLDYTVSSLVRQRMGNADVVYFPQGCYPCEGNDSWVAVTVRSSEDWRSLASVLQRPDLANLTDAVSRRRAARRIEDAITGWTVGRTSVEAFQELQRAGVPAAPCYSAKEMIEDPHLNARGFWPVVAHAEVGARPITGVVWGLSKTPGAVERSAPLLGEHTCPTLHRVLGLGQAELDRLESDGVLR